MSKMPAGSNAHSPPRNSARPKRDRHPVRTSNESGLSWPAHARRRPPTAVSQHTNALRGRPTSAGAETPNNSATLRLLPPARTAAAARCPTSFEQGFVLRIGLLRKSGLPRGQKGCRQEIKKGSILTHVSASNRQTGTEQSALLFRDQGRDCALLFCS